MHLKTGEIFKRIFGFSLASWVSAAINFFVLPISTRLFPTAELAKINLFYSVITILLSLVCFGLDQGYVRYFSEYSEEEDKKSLFSICLYLGSILLVIGTIVAIPFQKNIANWIVGDNDFPILLPLFFCLFNQLIYRYMSLYYRMRNSVLQYTIVAVMSSAVVKLSYLLGCIISPTGKIAIYIMMITSIAFSFVSFVLLRKKVKKESDFSKYVNKEFLKYCIPLIPVTFIIQINTYMPQYAIRYAGDFDEVGIFSTAVTLASILTLIQSGINVFWSPYVFENHSNGKIVIGKLQNIITLVMIGCGMVIIALKDVLVLILGNDYRGAILYMSLLIVGPVFATLGELTGVGMLLNKKGYLNLVITGIALMINVICAFLMTSKWGAIGAAMSSAIVASILFGLKTYFGQREYKSIGCFKSTLLYIILFLFVVVLNTVEQNPFSYVSVINWSLILLIGIILLKNAKSMMHNTEK